MASVNVYSAERMKQIEDESIVEGEIIDDNLVLRRRDGTEIVAGEVTAASISLSNDQTLADLSTTQAPTERATKLYVDAAISGVAAPPAPDLSGYAKKLTIKNITGNYSALLADEGKLITSTSGGSVTVTLPQNSSVAFPIGSQLNFVPLSGTMTFQAGSGATVTKPTSKNLQVLEVGAVVTAIKISIDGWLLVGALGSA